MVKLDISFPVLFTQQKSNYYNLQGFDCYDQVRNAFTCDSSLPGIYHPPCRRFSRLRGLSTAPQNERIFGYWSIGRVRKYGGIVEHPADSLLWKQCKVGTPSSPDSWGGYLISVNLSWFGYPAQKRTGLYIVGVPYKDLPALPLSFDAITRIVSSSRSSKLKEVSKSKRSMTPVKLCYWLRSVCILVYIGVDNSY